MRNLIISFVCLHSLRSIDTNGSLRLPRWSTEGASRGVQTIYFGILLITLTSRADAILDDYKFFNFFNNGEYDSAQKVLENKIIQNPHDVKTLYNLGDTFYEKKDFANAAKYYQNAVALLDDNQKKEETYFNLGNSYAQLKELEKALKAYSDALKINPNNKRARHNYEIIKKMLEKKKQQDQQQDKNKNQDKKDQKQDKQDEQKNNQDKNQKQDKKQDKQDQDKQNQSNQEQNKNKDSSQKQQENQKENGEGKQKREEQNQKNQEKPAQQNKPQQANNAARMAHKEELKKVLSKDQLQALDILEKQDKELNKQIVNYLVAANSKNEDENNW